MIYNAFKLKFKTGVHIGDTSLSDGELTFRSDSLFSALCSEAVKQSHEELEKLYNLFLSGALCISDAMPFVGDTLFLPKPICYIESKNNDGDSVVKKQFKKLKYISSESLEKYLEGKLEPSENLEKLNNLGSFSMRTNASIYGQEQSLPYNVGVYIFNEGSGLYVIAGGESEEQLSFLENCLSMLSYSGIGGRRSSGLGKFELARIKRLPDDVIKRLISYSGKSMLLSTALPTDDEMEKAMKNAEYSVARRGGFVGSPKFCSKSIRNKDVFMFTSGSCFENRFTGCILDVSRNGMHPVYRCGKPLWMGVEI